MPEVMIDAPDGPGPLAAMLGGLLRANLQAEPVKAALVTRTTGTVAITVTDTFEELCLRFDGADLWVQTDCDQPDLRLKGTADVIMGLSTMPLRFGLPDLLSGGGRVMTGRWVSGGLEIHGLPRGAPLLRTLLSLLSVIS
ncbi:MAG: hypothetical protein ACR2HR_10275 [Euzebya sp.]